MNIGADLWSRAKRRVPMYADCPSEIVYRIAEPAECDRIRAALLAYFYPEDLLTVSYIEEREAQPPRLGPSEQDIQHALSCVVRGMGVLAISGFDGTIIGVSIARCVTPTTADELLDDAKPAAACRKRSEMVNMFAHLERTGDVCGRFRKRRSYHVFVLAVDPRFRRRAVGQKLMEFQMARGKALRFRLVSADFGGERAARIGARLEMRCVAAVALDDYRNADGEQIFAAPGADNIVCTYARYV